MSDSGHPPGSCFQPLHKSQLLLSETHATGGRQDSVEGIRSNITLEHLVFHLAPTSALLISQDFQVVHTL